MNGYRTPRSTGVAKSGSKKGFGAKIECEFRTVDGGIQTVISSLKLNEWIMYAYE